MFLTIQDGAYTLNIHAIAEIEWSKTTQSADVTLLNGYTYTLEDADFEALVKLVDNTSV